MVPRWDMILSCLDLGEEKPCPHVSNPLLQNSFSKSGYIQKPSTKHIHNYGQMTPNLLSNIPPKQWDPPPHTTTRNILHILNKVQEQKEKTTSFPFKMVGLHNHMMPLFQFHPFVQSRNLASTKRAWHLETTDPSDPSQLTTLELKALGNKWRRNMILVGG